MLKKLRDIDIKTKIKFIVLLLFIIGIITLILSNHDWILNKLNEAEALRQYILSKGSLGIVAFMLIEALHVLFVVLPGDVLNFTGGYVYGIPIGFSAAMLGIMAGTISAFQISKVLGAEFVSKLIAEDRLKKIGGLLNSRSGALGILIICLLPFIPKDLLVYIAGLTPIKASRFFLLYGISRIPATLIGVTAGAQTQENDLQGLLITIAALACFVGIGVFLQKKYSKNI